MNESDHPPPAAPWQPVTAGGVAKFADATWGRVFLMVAVVAAICLGTILWFGLRIYLPAVETAIDKAPEEGLLRNGILQWPGESHRALYHDAFIEITTNFESDSPSGNSADLLIEITPRSLRIQSLFGYSELPYQSDWIAAVNRPGLKAWWGAWRGSILVLGSTGFVVLLLLQWLLLASLYCLPAWMLASLMDREVTLAGSWRLCWGALLPGALMICAAIVLYGNHYLNLLGLLAAVPLHLIAAWIYLPLAIRKLDQQATAVQAHSPGSNPFQTRPGKTRNPFA